MPAKSIMIQGTMSNAGKSVLAAGLCRIFRQDGLSVAPFKSQNMALNSFITREGLEMGRAQVMQAEAAGTEPSVRMNPILLKPNSDTGSQVIVNGEVLGNMGAADYFRYKKRLVPQIMEAYQSLAAEYDVIVLEGAGSPAEINLKADDIVNMGMARLAKAPVLLAGDIDRGGVFAALYGTVAPAGAGGAGPGPGDYHQQIPGGRGDFTARPVPAGGPHRGTGAGGGPLAGPGPGRGGQLNRPLLCPAGGKAPGRRRHPPAPYLQLHRLRPPWSATRRWGCGILRGRRSWAGPI